MASRRNGQVTEQRTPIPPIQRLVSCVESRQISARTEILYITIYPLTLLLGSLFSLLDPATRAAPYSVDLQSHPPEFAPSYFALKSNVLNRYFVKVNWFWVTLAYAIILILRTFRLSRDNASARLAGFKDIPALIQSIARYTAVTILWIAVTQWFFGPALIDRGFRITGGLCEIDIETSTTVVTQSLFSGQACKRAGGKWRGGHDISGHVFILVLGSGLLVREILPVLVSWWQELAGELRVVGDEGNIGRQDGFFMQNPVKWAACGPLLVICLNWWMLFMTAIYFHTWIEKLTGLLVALAGLSFVYQLPKVSHTMQQIVGFPE